jgi:hypothetical protein
MKLQKIELEKKPYKIPYENKKRRGSKNLYIFLKIYQLHSQVVQ